MKRLAMMGAVLLAATACKPGAGIKGDKGEAGAKVITEKLKSDPETLAKLKPTEGDIKDLFEESAVAPIKTHVEKMYSELKSLEMKEDPSDIHCYTQDEIKAWKDIQHLPGGYKRVGDKLKSGVVVCAFKSGGISYDGLMWVDGKWFFIAKPFRAIEKE